VDFYFNTNMDSTYVGKYSTSMCFHLVYTRFVEVCIIHVFAYGFRVLTFYIGVHKMLYIFFHFKPIKPLSYGHFCGLFAMVPFHQHIMFFFAWSLYTISLLAHKFKIASIWTTFLSRWCLLPFSTFSIPWNNVEQVGLAHRPTLSSI